MTGQFLASDVNGKDINVGDTVFSTYHKRDVVVLSKFDACDGDVYLCFDGGNLSVKSARKVAKLNRIQVAIDVASLMLAMEAEGADVESVKDRLDAFAKKIREEYGVMEYTPAELIDAILTKYGV